MTQRTRLARIALLGATVGLLAALASASLGAAAGKPGYPDKVTWNGAVWSVKTSRSAVGPGPCVFAKANVSVAADDLHLRISRSGSTWTCAEVIGPTSFGYGTYTFTLVSDVSDLDPNVVLGLFTWSDKAPYAHREVDIEVADWGDPTASTNAQYVFQPWDVSGHLVRFNQPAVARSTHAFTWRAGTIAWQSRAGDGSHIASYAYSGADVPRPGDERVRLNLWLFGGAAPMDGQPVEVVVESFVFTP